MHSMFKRESDALEMEITQKLEMKKRDCIQQMVVISQRNKEKILSVNALFTEQYQKDTRYRDTVMKNQI